MTYRVDVAAKLRQQMPRVNPMCADNDHHFANAICGTEYGHVPTSEPTAETVTAQGNGMPELVASSCSFPSFSPQSEWCPQ